MTTVFISCVAVLVYHFALYPLVLLVLGAMRKEHVRDAISEEALPTVTVLVTCYNEGPAIAEKLDNLQQQNYPVSKLNILFAADGKEGNARVALEDRLSDAPNAELVEYPENRGKISVLNDTIPRCTGDIIVFTDVSALFDQNAIRELVCQLQLPDVGGVCGYHQLSTRGAEKLSAAQGIYWTFDGLLKKAEAKLGSISSCYGSIYAVRRELVSKLPSSVTDDAFQAMAVIRQGQRFAFAPKALAYIRPRAKSPGHEISRRRRVVVRSLRGLWLSRELFDIRKFGLYSLSLFSHKVLRRVMPLMLLLMLVSSASLALNSGVWLLAFLLQLTLYSCALLSFTHWAPRLAKTLGLQKPFSLAAYFVIGQLGTLLGAIDFMRGKRVDRWVPVTTGQ